MGMAEIRAFRLVPAKRGMRVFSTHSNRWGTIVGTASGYLKIRLDGDKHAMCYHPTWRLNYYDKNGVLLHSCDN